MKVDGATDLGSALTGRPDRDIVLEVQSAAKAKKGKRRKKKSEDGNGAREIREVTLRPISYGRARSLLYEKWIDGNQAAVAKASKGRLGYLHIQGMNMTSFYRFEEELYSVAAGKEGILIDVRENGGGSTTDHLLTILTQPRHAITVPRGGGRGYPHDRKIYASWNKPVAVLCNQNSYSNAEIFSHAIKTLKRGKVIGVPTAGGVISTGGRSIMDIGYLRMPFRGWYLLNDGQDMELHGAVPHHIVWPEPGDLPSGSDPQLKRAIKALTKDVKKYRNRPQPPLINSSERDGK
jgi:tricorn protease